jgi:hypothetical protein
VVSTSALAINCDDTIKPYKNFTGIENDPKLPSSTTDSQTSHSNDFSAIIHKLSSLVIHLQTAQPAIESRSLTALHHQVDIVLYRNRVRDGCSSKEQEDKEQ